MMSDPTLFLIIKNGGPAAGLSAKMPAYGTRLSYDQMAQLVGYLRELCNRKSAGIGTREIPASSAQP